MTENPKPCNQLPRTGILRIVAVISVALMGVFVGFYWFPDGEKKTPGDSVNAGLGGTIGFVLAAVCCYLPSLRERRDREQGK